MPQHRFMSSRGGTANVAWVGREGLRVPRPEWENAEEELLRALLGQGVWFRGRPMDPYGDKVADVLANAEEYHRSFYRADTFRGPSLHFRRRAVQARQSGPFLAHVEPEMVRGVEQVGARGGAVRAGVAQLLDAVASGLARQPGRLRGRGVVGGA